MSGLLRNKLLMLMSGLLQLSDSWARNSLSFVIAACSVEPSGDSSKLLLRSKLLLLRNKLLLLRNKLLLLRNKLLLLGYKLLLLRYKLLLLRSKSLRSSLLRSKLLDWSGLLLRSGNCSSRASGLNTANMDIFFSGNFLMDVGLGSNFFMHIRHAPRTVVRGEGSGGGGQRKNNEKLHD